MADAPPSTRSSPIVWPAAAVMASTTSRVWYAIASTAGPGQVGRGRCPG